MSHLLGSDDFFVHFRGIMSVCVSSKRPFRRSALDSSWSLGEIDLNVDGTEDSNRSQGVNHQEPAIPRSDGREELIELLLWSNKCIDVEEIEDDVEVLSSSGDFSQVHTSNFADYIHLPLMIGAPYYWS